MDADSSEDDMTDEVDKERSSIVIAELERLITDHDLVALGSMEMRELRALRDRMNDFEGGLSYCRRMAQGRLDILMAEIERRGDQLSDDPLVGRIPAVLARQSRQGGSPRRLTERELPDFAAELVGRMNVVVDVLGSSLESHDLSYLMEAVDLISDIERDISLKRHEVHRVIDEIQEEIITRYRSGNASVEELLADS